VPEYRRGVGEADRLIEALRAARTALCRLDVGKSVVAAYEGASLHTLTVSVGSCNVSGTMPANPRHLILNLLLAADGGQLSAREAVASCGLFGVRESHARVALTRLAAAGLIESAGRGAYRLGPAAADLAAEVAGWRDVAQRAGPWDGGWVAVHVGALGRSDRGALRARTRAFELLGLREIERGLHLRPDNLVGGVAAVRARLLALGLDHAATVFAARDFDAERERRARTLWDGAALTRRYQDWTRRLGGLLARGTPRATEATLRDWYRAGNDAIRDMVFDPLLPAPLVDVDARRACFDAVLHFDAAGRAIWKHYLDAARLDPTATPPTPSRLLEITP
jgi:phenylacetic acid degradation operon negative regulatory protein